MSTSPVRLHLSATENSIEIDGQDITNRVHDLTLYAGADDLLLQVTYACLEGVDVDGIVEVRHVCPLAEGDDS